MKIKVISRYMRTLSNEQLKKLLPVLKKDKDGKERSVEVSLFRKDAQTEISRRKRKGERMMKKTSGVSVLEKAA